ncbi:hypothetical protein GLYMA_03G212600v4 [Glycine max]|uniref:Secreted protein n=1 Tax=Glycine max TaxID=3847 RepID=K7KGA9_SOYBN|nr:hypothetical protein JHK87_007978 [Glycine soja]KAH1071119.1 hypothetical protein GYH30_007931 [Glycine max]KRH68161.1 hypothetical protein GLYMA_03G212600v4 [Glycine max]
MLSHIYIILLCQYIHAGSGVKNLIRFHSLILYTPHGSNLRTKNTESGYICIYMCVHTKQKSAYLCMLAASCKMLCYKLDSL